MSKKKIAAVFGIRPEAIKLALVILALKADARSSAFSLRPSVFHLFNSTLKTQNSPYAFCAFALFRFQLITQNTTHNTFFRFLRLRGSDDSRFKY
jgi:hypothetical protein